MVLGFRLSSHCAIDMTRAAIRSSRAQIVVGSACIRLSLFKLESSLLLIAKKYIT